MERREEKLAFHKAKKRVENLKAFYIMIFIYMVLLAVYLLARGEQEFFVLGPFLNGWLFSLWGFFIVLFGAYLYLPFFRNWEDRQMRKYLQKYSESDSTWD